jgi:hypothetical protein
VKLDLHSHKANVNLKVHDISQRMSAGLPDVLVDLLEVATYVFCADQATGRGTAFDTGEKWHRHFEFFIPVRQPDLWSSQAVRTALVDVLSFLSDDDYEFTFSELKKRPSEQLYFENFVADFAADDVALFSGGLDSLAGALQATLGDKRRLAVVSHRSSTKKEPAVEHLVTDLRARCGADRLFHVPVWITKDEHLGREYTQRSRSFLYAALGATVASMLGRDRFSFYENGVTSLNLPVSPQLVGSRATRTTHPKAIEGFGTFLTALLQKPFAVHSPFLWRTKTEVVKLISDLGCRDLIRHSRSCTRTFEATKLWPHCGTCSQCVDRRFAMLAAGLADEDPSEAYKVDLLTGERDVGEPRTVAEQYVQRATKMNGADEARFYTDFPEASRVLRRVGLPVADAAVRVRELHDRHAKDVLRVLDEAIAAHATDLRAGKLKNSCLIVLAATGPYAGTSTSQPPTFRREGQYWRIWFDNETTTIEDSVGARHIARLLAAPGKELGCLELVALESGDPAPAQPGSSGLATDAKAIRQYKRRLEELGEQLDTARAAGQGETALVLQEEHNKLAAHLSSVTAKGGRARKAGDAGERARKTVLAAIRRPMDVLKKDHPGLWRHLFKHLKTGTYCQYSPEPAVTWVTT